MRAMDQVTVDPDGPYFVANGERWFPSGWCCAKPEVLTPDDLRRMADAGCNTVRLWPDHNETGVLREDLPELVHEAGALGIRSSVTMLNLGELSDLFIDQPNLKRLRNAYRELCETPQELLTSSAARDLSRRRIDGYLDLLGDSPDVWSWVVCSQLDGVYQAPAKVLDDFTSELAGYLADEEQRRFGVQRRRTVTSFDPLPVWDSVYSAAELDVVGLHCYSPAVYSPVDGLQAAWEIALATAAACRRRPAGRPVHCVEYGSILHLFLLDHPMLPADLLRRWRRNTCLAHLCAGGAGGPLLVPPAVSDAPAPAGPEVTGLADLVRPTPRVIPRELEPEERAFRRLLRDPLLQTLQGDPMPIRAPQGTLAVACGSGGDGSLLLWVAADSRLTERGDLVRRALEGDPGVSPLLGYDAGSALVEACGAALWNPGSRLSIGKLMDKDLDDVATERIRAGLDKMRWLLGQLDVPARPTDLGGVTVELPGAHGRRRFRCYDPSSGEVVASGTTSGELVLPELAEAVVAVDPAGTR
jgi:hypothetical protein